MPATRTWLPALGLFLLVFVVFGRALVQGFAPSDDLFLVVENLAVRGPTWANLKTVFTSYDPELYIPLTFVSYQIDYLVGGINPWIFHLTNLLLHAVNSVLVWRLLTRFTSVAWLALAAAALYAVHPLQTEAVVWIAGRKDLLSGTFALLSFLAYMRYREGKRYGYIASLLLFLAAVLAKVSVVTLPAVFLLYEWLVRGQPFQRRQIQRLVPYCIIALLFIWVALAGKERVVGALDSFELLLVAGKSTVFYIFKFFFPAGLTIIYPLNPPVEVLPLLPYLLAAAGLVVTAVMIWRKAPLLAFGILCYGILLSPSFSNPAKAGFIFFAVDRYVYIAIMGLLVILLWLAERVINWQKVLILGLAGLSIAASATLSWHQVRTWDSPESLYARSIELYPESVAGRASLAKVYRQQGREPEAFEVLREGLKYSNHPALYLEAGYIYARVGQVADAREQFLKAKAIDPVNPEPLFALGSLAEQTGQEKQAVDWYRQAVVMDDSYVIAHVKLANLLWERGEKNAARQHLQAALEWNPSAKSALDLAEKFADPG